MKKIILPFVILVSITSLAQDQSNTAEINTIANANNQLAFDLFTEISEKEKGNLFYSPFSVSTALAMTYAGSAGRTEAEMAQVLHFQPNTPSFHQNFGAYLARLAENAKGNIEFEMANRLWVEKNFKFKDSFFDLVNSAYGASTEKADFINNYEEARKVINEWVAQKTNRRIKDLIPVGVLDENTRMVLVNAIYFKGDWLHPFDSLETRNDVFHVEKGKDVTARFMKQTGYFNYATGEHCKMMRLPYKGDKQSMVVVLPNGIGDMDATEKEIQRIGFDKLKYSAKQQLNISFPKFKMTMPLALKKYFKELNMLNSFEEEADFSKMDSTKRLYISEIVHKAFVEVDEKGTEAAAATAVVMAVKTDAALHIPIVIPFVADHPFLYYIVDNETNAILFMGRMCEPGLD